MKLRVKLMLDGHPYTGTSDIYPWLDAMGIAYLIDPADGKLYVEVERHSTHVAVGEWVVRFYGGRIDVVDAEFVNTSYEVFDDNGDPFVVEVPARDEF